MTEITRMRAMKIEEEKEELEGKGKRKGRDRRAEVQRDSLLGKVQQYANSRPGVDPPDQDRNA